MIFGFALGRISTPEKRVLRDDMKIGDIGNHATHYLELTVIRFAPALIRGIEMVMTGQARFPVAQSSDGIVAVPETSFPVAQSSDGNVAVSDNVEAFQCTPELLREGKECSHADMKGERRLVLLSDNRSLARGREGFRGRWSIDGGRSYFSFWPQQGLDT